MTQNIIITGANGFIGTAMKTYYKKRGDAVMALTRSNCDYAPQTIKNLIDRHKPDFLIHTAGNASIQTSFDNPEQFNRDTIDLTKNILEGITAAIHPVRFVGLSSAAVYGSPKQLPISEDTELLPISPYGATKLACEHMVQSYGEKLSLPAVIIRIFSLFGEGQKRLVLYELFRQFQAPDTDSVKLRGTGQETRDYLSIGVFAQKVAALLDALKITPSVTKKADVLRINVASGESHEIGQCAQIMKKLLVSPKNIDFQAQRIEGQPDHWEADTALYDQIVKAKIPFNFGEELAKTLTAWKSQEKT